MANERFRRSVKEKELLDMLRIEKKLTAEKVYSYSPEKGWQRLSIETSDMRLVPLLVREPADESYGYVIICDPGGKRDIPLSIIDSLAKTGAGIVIEDLTGTGELTSTNSIAYDYAAKLHTLSRAELWLGRTVIGEWVREIDLVTRYLFTSKDARNVSIFGIREAGLAGLFYGALGGKVESVTLLDAPVSYLFDDRETVDYFSMGIHIPGFLKWGDVSLAAALGKNDVRFINPLTMSGRTPGPEMMDQYRKEYYREAKICSKKGKISFE